VAASIEVASSSGVKLEGGDVPLNLGSIGRASRAILEGDPMLPALMIETIETVSDSARKFSHNVGAPGQDGGDRDVEVSRGMGNGNNSSSNNNNKNKNNNNKNKNNNNNNNNDNKSSNNNNINNNNIVIVMLTRRGVPC
jgi:hypothetical protein